MKTLLAILFLLPSYLFAQHPEALIFRLSMAVREVHFDTTVCTNPTPVLIGFKYDTLGFMFNGKTLILYPVHVDVKDVKILVKDYADSNKQFKVELFQDKWDELYLVSSKEGTGGVIIFINNLTHRLPVYLLYLGMNQDEFCVND